jgi:hypothetical protein
LKGPLAKAWKRFEDPIKMLNLEEADISDYQNGILLALNCRLDEPY